jgi:Na+/proline symporter
MSRTRVRFVFLLLILILLVVSALLGLFTWWLGQQPPPQDRGASSELWPADDPAASAFPAVVRVKR